MLFANSLHYKRDIDIGDVVKYKYILPAVIHFAFIYILCADTEHKQKEMGPGMTKLVNEIAALYLAKKRSNDHQREYQDQKTGEHYNSIKGVNGLYKTQKIPHSSVRR